MRAYSLVFQRYLLWSKNNGLAAFTWLLVGLALPLIPIISKAQPCPGGVTGVAGNVKHWIKADSCDCATHLCDIAFVDAKVGAQAILDPAGTGSLKRTNTGISTNNSLLINGKWLNSAVASSFSNNFSVFVVGKSTGGSSPSITNWYDKHAFVGSSKAGAADNRFAITYDGGSIGYGEDATTASFRAEVAGFSGVPFVAAMVRNKTGSTDDQLSLNGATTAFNARNVDLNDFDKVVIGSQKSGVSTANLNGEVAEVIIYDAKLNATTEVPEVVTYLAIRHGITLTTDYENLSSAGKIYQLDGHFNNHIMGLAHEDISRLLQTVNRSATDTGLVVMYGNTIPNAAPPYGPMLNNRTVPTTFPNSSYLMIGDDNSSPTFNATIGPGSTFNRIGRNFKVTETGTVGTVTLWFKNITYNQLTAGQTYYLAYGSDSILGIGETFVPMTLVPGTGSNDFYVQVDFPPGTSYFTITKDNIFPAPGSVAKGLNFWVKSDGKKTGPTSAITALRDMSYNRNNATTTSPNGAWAPPATQLNYHAILTGTDLDQDWPATQFIGQTIVAVGSASGASNSNNDGYMGFANDMGLRESPSTVNLQLAKNNNSNDWTDGAGVLRQNGAANNSPFVNSYSVIYGERATPNTASTFYLGGYFNSNSRQWTNYNFNEVLVYDRKLTANQMSNLESYLAIKYGLTLAHDYTGSDSVAIYNRLTPFNYSFDIFGIGQSINGALSQRQSTSYNSTSIVTISLGTIAASDSLNVAAFGGDKSYLIAGCDNAPTTCFTTDELIVNTPTNQAGEFVRVQREWKYQMSGIWTAAQSINFILESNNSNQLMPPLPTGSTQYYLFVSDNPSFKTGNVTAYPMTAAGTKHTAVITANNLPNVAGVGYFTFGTQLRPSDITQSACEGSSKRVVIYRSHIGDAGVCSFLELNGSLGTFDFIRGASATDTTFTTVNNGVGSACLDSLILIVPAIVTADNYTVLLDTAGSCPGVATHVNNADVMIDNLNITPKEKAAVTWGTPGDTIFCVGEPNVLATKGPLCTVGKLKFVSAPGGITNITQIIPDTAFASPNFGTIITSALPVGNYVIRFVTNGGGSCKDSLTYRFEIRATSTTAIAYSSPSYCGGAGAQNVTLTGLAGGTYSIFPASASGAINPTSGQVTISAIANPGTYQVIYTPPVGMCASSSNTSLTVSSALQANFHYLQDDFCRGTGMTAPFISNRPASGYFHLAASSPMSSIIGLDTATGFIDLNTALAGTYHIEYFVDTTACHKDTQDTIVVHNTPATAFTLGGVNGDTLCYANGFVKLNAASGGGVFHIWHTNLLLQPVTPFDSVKANGVLGGPFKVYYVNNDPFCPDSTSRDIFVHGLQTATIQYPSATICKNEANVLPQFISGSAGGSFLTPTSGLDLNATTGLIRPALSTAGTYIVQYKTSDPFCYSIVNVDTITIQAAPNPAFNFVPTTLCQDTGAIAIATLPGLPIVNNFTVWSGSTAYPTGMSGINVISDSLDGGLTYEIRNIAVQGACRDTAYDYFTVNEREVANIDFLPPIICLGDNNPHPYNYGTQGGFYTSVIPGDSVDYASGTVMVGTTVDTFMVRYTTSGACPSTDVDTLVVAQFIDASFRYDQVYYCVTQVMDTTDPSITNPGLGSFTYVPTPANLFLDIDSLTGHVNLGNSQPGTYDVKYTINQSGSCKAEATKRIYIEPHDSVSQFTLPYGPHCPSILQLHPTFSPGTDTAGTFSGDPGLIFAVEDSGYVSLSQSLPGIHTVYYHLPGSCNDIIQSTFEILNKDTADFDYGTLQTAFCNGQPAVFPRLLSPNTPGSFQIIDDLHPTAPQSPPFVNATGEIHLPTSHATGNFSVYHYTTGICPDTFRVVVSISDIPADADLRAEPGATLCVGEDVRVVAAGDARNTSFFRGNNPTVISTDKEIVLSDVVGRDTIYCLFTTAFGCQIRDSIFLLANEVPSDTVLYVPKIIKGGEPFSIFVHSLSDSTFMTWSLDNIQGGVTFPNSPTFTGLTDTIMTGDSIPITQLVALGGDFDPAEFTYIITPWAKGCRGKERRVTVRVNPDGQDIFIPGVFTPDGNGKNDTWQIQLRNGIDENQYTILLYNEAGAKVYTMHPLTSTWDGAGLPDGVYWYSLLDATGKSIDQAGVTIRRKPITK